MTGPDASDTLPPGRVLLAVSDEIDAGALPADAGPNAGGHIDVVSGGDYRRSDQRAGQSESRGSSWRTVGGFGVEPVPGFVFADVAVALADGPRERDTAGDDQESEAAG